MQAVATITDYSTLLDDEIRAFAAETATWYPPDTAEMPVERQRAVYDAMCRAFFSGYPPGVRTQDGTFAGIACRTYEISASGPATVIYLHGGGFVVGGLHSHDDICAEICAATGFRTISVDYPLAPEHRHPENFAGGLAATRAIAARHGGRLVLAGDSAGANLAAAICQATRGEALGIAGQMLIYPSFGGNMETGSYVAHAQAPMLSIQDVLASRLLRFGPGGPDPKDATGVPLGDSDFSRLPPTLVHAAECDPVCDDGPAYAAAILAAGGRARCTVEAGLVHGYLRARTRSARAAASFARILAGISALGAGDWPV